MPLVQRAGDKIDSRYCGVETESDDDVPQVLKHNLCGGFEFLLAPAAEETGRRLKVYAAVTLHVSCGDLCVYLRDHQLKSISGGATKLLNKWAKRARANYLEISSNKSTIVNHFISHGSKEGLHFITQP